MILLAIAGGIAGSSLSIGGLLVTIALALGFVAFFALGGTAVTRARPGILQAPRFADSPLMPGVLICLGLAALAAQVGLAAIIGALLAGMIVAETKEQHPVEEEVAPLYALFPPFFFAYIGLQVDLGALADGETLLLVAAVTVLAVVTKFAGAWVGARSLGSREARSLPWAWSRAGRSGSSWPASARRPAWWTTSCSRSWSRCRSSRR